MAINGVSRIADNVITEMNKAKQTDENNTISFGDYLSDALKNVNALQLESDKVTEDFITGKIDSIHDVTIAAEKASISLQLAIEVRNKVLEAYQEIMRMQV